MWEDDTDYKAVKEAQDLVKAARERLGTISMGDSWPTLLEAYRLVDQSWWALEAAGLACFPAP